ncbi:alpha/beta hydrolase family protein [Fischerella sp. PCC 9605]|uniref:alpha/beta hydrolase family protein n=1 Tax=Fischerella sp. PCC 9605 TaxID=1173024 RepID=UPI0004B93C0C|nr:alpha/beta hydrolase [Fischerella sp. PCC 9605]
MASLKALSVASASTALIVWGIGETARATTYSPAPIFKDVDSYSTTISANNDIADIYFPKPSGIKTGKHSFPIALLLQGANVDKSNYSNFARTVASYGFVVVVPNHQKNIPQVGTGLFADTSQIDAVLAQMKAENANPDSPVAGIVNTRKLGLLGHSQGGAVGLSVIANLCIPFLCEGFFNRPKELVAGAFFGANLRDQTTQQFIPINNSRIPVALLQGTLDSIALPERAQATYEQIQDPPKTLISILGANHYGITNTDNSTGARPDINIPTLAQSVAVETVARWSGLFLRASILNDRFAFNYVYFTGDILDPNVSAIAQTKKKIPQASCKWGLVAFGSGGNISEWVGNTQIKDTNKADFDINRFSKLTDSTCYR